MRETRLTLPELGLVAGTRAAIGAGLGLLLADRFSESQRKAVGWTLFLMGTLSTIPLGFEIFGRSCATTSAETSRRQRDGRQEPSNRANEWSAAAGV